MAILEIHDLVKRYGSGTLANDHISLELEPGEVYGLLGPNGAGKTTLVRQLLGLLRPTSGTITVEGVDVVADPGFARRRIGFLPQSQLDLQSLHVDELIRYAARLRGMPGIEADRRTEEVIERLDLEEFRKTSLHSASGGIRRLAGFAATLVGGTRLLVLDEPTNDVDPLRRQLLWNTIAEEGRNGTTVLLVTHNLAEAERVIDRLAIIDGGRILREGSPASLRSLVTNQLKLELAAAGPLAPHPALLPDGRDGAYLFAQADLGPVSGWLSTMREIGKVTDFRIGPPSLDDIYAVTVRAPRQGRELEPAR
ncbi:MAG TPA: ABC transporter ATP-binding protein [Tepidiformaceae bacterium]|nr:ABC transporter ATP-binding protein [Tepidiformaceae bacterium]